MKTTPFAALVAKPAQSAGQDGSYDPGLELWVGRGSPMMTQVQNDSDDAQTTVHYTSDVTTRGTTTSTYTTTYSTYTTTFC